MFICRGTVGDESDHLPALRLLLNQTGTGRAVANLVVDDKTTSTARTSRWVKGVGSRSWIGIQKFETDGGLMRIVSLDSLIDTGPDHSTESREGDGESGTGIWFTSTPEDADVRNLLYCYVHSILYKPDSSATNVVDYNPLN